jgi:hypothetical protein
MVRGRKSSLRIVRSPEEQHTLERWQRSTTIAAGRTRRGKIILLLAAGASPSAVAQAVGVQRTVVRHWAKRVLAQRLDGRSDAPGRGAKGGFSPGGRDPRGAPGLRTPGSVGSSPLPVGWRRTGAPTHCGGPCGEHLRGHRTTDSGRASAEAMAPSSVATPQTPAGHRFRCYRRRAA